MKDQFTEAGFTLAWKLVARTPTATARAAFDAIADQMWRRNGASARQLQRNLARVRPDASEAELRELTRSGLRSYMRYWCEAFQLPRWSQQRVQASFDIENVALLRDAVAAGNGAIMVLGHSGNWDLAGAWWCDQFGTLTTVAERLKPQGLFEQFIAYRESLGMEILGHDDPDTFRVLRDRLRSGGLVCLVGDRDLSSNGVPVDFFGEETSMPAGPAMLALLTGAPLHPVTLWYSKDRAHARVLDRVEVPTAGDRAAKIAQMTQDIADGLATGVREHPEDWHMLQPFWLADRKARRA